MTNKCCDQTASPISANLLYFEEELILCGEKSGLQENRAQEPSVEILRSSPVLLADFTVCLPVVSVVTDNHLCVCRDGSQEKSALGLLKGITQFSRVCQ